MRASRPRWSAPPVRVIVQVLLGSAVVHDLACARARPLVVGELASCDLHIPSSRIGASSWLLISLDRTRRPELLVPQGSRVSVDIPGQTAGSHGPYRSHATREHACVHALRIPLLPGTHVRFELGGLTFLVTATEHRAFRSAKLSWKALGGIGLSAILHLLLAALLFIAPARLLPKDDDMPEPRLISLGLAKTHTPVAREASWVVGGARQSFDPDPTLGVRDREHRGGPSRAIEGETGVVSSGTRPDRGRAPSSPSLIAPATRTQQSPSSTFAILAPGGSNTRARQRLLAGALPDRSDIQVEDFLDSLPPGPRAARPLASPAVQMRVDAMRSPYVATRFLVRLVVQAPATAPQPARRVLVMERLEATAQVRRVVRRLTEGVAYAVVSYGEDAHVAAGWSRNRADSRLGAIVASAAQRPRASENPGLAAALAATSQLACGGAEGKADTDVVIVFGRSTTLSGMELARWVEDARACDVRALSSVHLGEGGTELASQLANWRPGRHLAAAPARGERSDLERPGDPLAPNTAEDLQVRVTFDAATVLRYRSIGRERGIDPLWSKDADGEAFTSTLRSGERAIAMYDVEPASGRLPVLRAEVWYRVPGTADVNVVEAELGKSDCYADARSAPEDLRLSAAVTGLAELLRGSPYAQGWSPQTMLRLARGARGSAEAQDSLLRYLAIKGGGPPAARRAGRAPGSAAGP